VEEQLNTNKGLKIMQDSIATSPVAGQSLTNPKDNSYPWESPPQITNLKKAMHDIFETLIEPDIFENVTSALERGVPVLDISSAMLYQGFETGKWNPDLMLLLQEPTMYMVMAMGEKAGIDKIRVYSGEEKDDADLYGKDMIDLLDEEIKLKDVKPKQIQKDSVPEEIQKEIENIEVSSLLAKKTDEEEPSNKSLLNRS